MKRKDFIKKFSMLAVGTTIAGNAKNKFAQAKIITESPTKVSTNKEVIIEWNHHIFSPDLQQYPFHPKATYEPDVSNNPKDPLAAYLQQLDDRGVDRAVIVQPEPYGDDHSLILESLKRKPDRLRGTSLFYPRDPEAPQKLAELVKREPHIVATRFHASRGSSPYFDSFADPAVRALWQKAVDLGIIVELHIGPSFASQAGEAIKAFPNCKVIIDHLAEQQYGTPVEYADVLDLARFPNVYMKLSGLNHFSDDGPLYKSVRPFTSRVIEEFGPDQMVWGSGTPHIVDAHMEGYSEAEIAKVKGGNIRRLLKW